MAEESSLLDALQALVPGGGIRVEKPDIMEAYDQRCDVVDSTAVLMLPVYSPCTVPGLAPCEGALLLCGHG